MRRKYTDSLIQWKKIPIAILSFSRGCGRPAKPGWPWILQKKITKTPSISTLKLTNQSPIISPYPDLPRIAAFPGDLRRKTSQALCLTADP